MDIVEIKRRVDLLKKVTQQNTVLLPSGGLDGQRLLPS